MHRALARGQHAGARGSIAANLRAALCSMLLLAVPACCSVAVCRKVLGAVQDGMSKSEMKDKLNVEAAISKYCKSTKKDSKEKKLCYFIEPIKREISVPTSNGVPADRICRRLKKKTAEICSIRYAEKIDLSSVDLSKLRVRQLRKILSDHGVACNNCLEKADYIREVRKALGKDEL